VYLEAKVEREVLFGDIFAADWLFDAWLESDAQLVGLFTAKGGNPAYGAHARTSESDFLLAHGKKPRAVLALNDDCNLQTITVRYGQGRILCAPIFDFDKDKTEAAKQRQTRAYGRFPLLAGEEFDGGIAELRYAFGVELKNASRVAELKDARRAALDPSARRKLESRWGAYTARRGPDVAQRTAEKLTALLPEDAASDDASKAVARLLAATWSLEGQIADQIDSVYERREAGVDRRQLIADLTGYVDELAGYLAPARAALRSLQS
jgi:hypothetical protein